jgi:hypothetical protein
VTEVATAGAAAVRMITGPPRPIDLLLSGMSARIIDGSAGSKELIAALDLWNVDAEQDPAGGCTGRSR